MAISSVGKYAEYLEALYIAGVSVKWHKSHWRIDFAILHSHQQYIRPHAFLQ